MCKKKNFSSFNDTLTVAAKPKLKDAEGCFDRHLIDALTITVAHELLSRAAVLKLWSAYCRWSVEKS